MYSVIRIAPAFDPEPLKKFVSERVIPVAARARNGMPFPEQIYRDLHGLGWLQSFVPEEYGGLGLPIPDLIHVARALAYGSAGVFTSWTVNPLALLPLARFARPEVRLEVCGEFCREFGLAAFCSTEPDTGFDIGGLKTQFRRVDGGYLLRGKKCFITNATVARHLVVTARDGSEPDRRNNLSVFYVPASSRGVSRGKPLEKMGQHDSNTGELYFDDVFIPEGHLLGELGRGLEIAHYALQRSKTLVAGAAVGVAERAMQLVTRELMERVRYGQPLLALPVIQHHLARIRTEMDAAWLLTCRSAAAVDSGERGMLEASQAKMHATNMAVQAVSEIVELFGGYGYSREFEIERLHRDIRVLEIYEGSTFIQEALIAREIFPEMYRRRSGDRKKESQAA